MQYSWQYMPHMQRRAVRAAGACCGRLLLTWALPACHAALPCLPCSGVWLLEDGGAGAEGAAAGGDEDWDAPPAEEEEEEEVAEVAAAAGAAAGPLPAAAAADPLLGLPSGDQLPGGVGEAAALFADAAAHACCCIVRLPTAAATCALHAAAGWEHAGPLARRRQGLASLRRWFCGAIIEPCAPLPACLPACLAQRGDAVAAVLGAEAAAADWARRTPAAAGGGGFATLGSRPIKRQRGDHEWALK